MFKRKLSEKSRIYHNWTITAYECYKRGCVCDGCKNRIYCEVNGHTETYGKPHLKYAVEKLLKNLGQEGLRAFEETGAVPNVTLRTSRIRRSAAGTVRE